MSQVRAIDALLDEYGESHQNPANKAIHWLAVPVIVSMPSARSASGLSSSV